MEHATSERSGAGRAVIPATQVRVSTEPARVEPPRHAGDCEPRIDLIRDGDQIRAIDIRCGCGKRIFLQCEY